MQTANFIPLKPASAAPAVDLKTPAFPQKQRCLSQMNAIETLRIRGERIVPGLHVAIAGIGRKWLPYLRIQRISVFQNVG